MTFVPELTSRKGDPWAARKGEPRGMALGWCMYMMACAAGTVLQTRSVGMTLLAPFQRAATHFCLLILIGACILWPMARLSQASGKGGPLRATLVDVMAVLLPLQVVLWPLPLATGWGWGFVLGIITLIAAWSFGCIAFTHACITPQEHPRGRAVEATPGSRLAVMLALVLVIGLPPAVIGLASRVNPGLLEHAGWLGTLSPLSELWILTHPPSGLVPRMTSLGWTSAAGALMLGLAALAVRGLWGKPRPLADQSPGGVHSG